MSFQYKYNRSLIHFSQINRKQQTEAEKMLWKYLRNKNVQGYKFRRQYPIDNFILDFYCVEKKLAIELDGSQHVKQESYDVKRTNKLKSLNIKVIRFWDNDVLQNIDGVLERIVANLIGEPHPSLS